MKSNAGPPETRKAVEAIDRWIHSTESKRDGVVRSKRYLDLSTFALGMATGATALYGANRPIALGSSLGAVGSYTAGSLFFPQETATLYTAAVQGLSCVRSRGASFVAVVADAE